MKKTYLKKVKTRPANPQKNAEKGKQPQISHINKKKESIKILGADDCPGSFF